MPLYGLLAAALLALGAFARPAGANSSSPPQYSLSVVEGETTQSEFENVGTSGGISKGSPEISIAIIRGGTEIVRASGKGGASTSQIPQVGDVVTLESPRGTPIGSEVYDGLPTIDPTVCAGSENFSGQRTPGEEVKGGYFSFRTHTDPYNSYLERTGIETAQVTTLAGGVYGGSFLAALAIGQTVYANETIEVSLPAGAVFEYASENERPVGACPAPPPPPPPAPVPPALQGTILKFIRTTIHKLLKSGFSDVVGINQPGTVTQDLYLQGGTLPATAASRKGKHHAKPAPALLLARGTATAKVAGDVTVHLKLTKRGRSRLKRAKRVKAVLITTLRTGGRALSLERRTVSLHN
jgi:hypothetical protein